MSVTSNELNDSACYTDTWACVCSTCLRKHECQLTNLAQPTSTSCHKPYEATSTSLRYRHLGQQQSTGCTVPTSVVVAQGPQARSPCHNQGCSEPGARQLVHPAHLRPCPCTSTALQFPQADLSVSLSTAASSNTCSLKAKGSEEPRQTYTPQPTPTQAKAAAAVLAAARTRLICPDTGCTHAPRTHVLLHRRRALKPRAAHRL